MVVKQDGSLWATGYNAQGQLGDGSNTNRNTFKEVMTGVKAVTAGSYHTMVLKQDGSLWATGYNKNGQLGDGEHEQERVQGGHDRGEDIGCRH